MNQPPRNGSIGQAYAQGQDPGSVAQQPAYPQQATYPQNAAYAQHAAYAQNAAYAQHAGYAQHGAYPQQAGYVQSAAYPQQAAYAQHGANAQQSGYLAQAAYPQPVAYPPQAAHPGAVAYPPQIASPNPPAPVEAVRAPSIGIAGVGPYGMPRLSISTGDFSVEALKAAVFEGKGFGKPRLFGLAFVGLAVAFTVGNYALVMVLHRFYPYLYSLAAVFVWGGLWLVATGQPRAQADGGKASTWGRVGLALCLGLGILSGIAMVVLPWESMVGM